MNKHVFIFVLSMLTNVLLHSPVQAQLCGGGTFTFEIYTLNGKESGNINYEILPVNMDSIKKVFQQPRFDLYRGEMINAIYVNKAVGTAEERELEKALAFRDNKRTGSVKDGVLEFKTTEVVSHPCILHLSSNKKDVYILANIVGGCNRTTAVLWNEYPQLVTSY